MRDDFRPGDIGPHDTSSVGKGVDHYVQNTGPEDLVFVAVFRVDRNAEV